MLCSNIYSRYCYREQLNIIVIRNSKPWITSKGTRISRSKGRISPDGSDFEDQNLVGWGVYGKITSLSSAAAKLPV